MKIVSLDIETTGVSKDTDNQILEVSALIFDTNDKEYPSIDNCPTFNVRLNYDFISGSPFALNMNKKLIEDMVTYQKHKKEYDNGELEDQDLIALCHQYLIPNELAEAFASWLIRNDITGDINIAGKNPGVFDIPFLVNTIPGWSELIKYERRFIDPAILYNREGDTRLPDLSQCKERSGLFDILGVSHHALEDAEDIAKLVYHKLGKDRQIYHKNVTDYFMDLNRSEIGYDEQLGGSIGINHGSDELIAVRPLQYPINGFALGMNFANINARMYPKPLLDKEYIGELNPVVVRGELEHKDIMELIDKIVNQDGAVPKIFSDDIPQQAKEQYDVNLLIEDCHNDIESTNSPLPKGIDTHSTTEYPIFRNDDWEFSLDGGKTSCTREEFEKWHISSRGIMYNKEQLKEATNQFIEKLKNGVHPGELIHGIDAKQELTKSLEAECNKMSDDLNKEIVDEILKSHPGYGLPFPVGLDKDIVSISNNTTSGYGKVHTDQETRMVENIKKQYEESGALEEDIEKLTQWIDNEIIKEVNELGSKQDHHEENKDYKHEPSDYSKTVEVVDKLKLNLNVKMGDYNINDDGSITWDTDKK